MKTLERTGDGNYLDTWSGSIYSPEFIHTEIGQKIISINYALSQWERVYIPPYRPYVKFSDNKIVFLSLARCSSVIVIPLHQEIELIFLNPRYLDLNKIEEGFCVENNKIYTSWSKAVLGYHEEEVNCLSALNRLQNHMIFLQGREIFECDRYLESVFPEPRYKVRADTVGRIIMFDTWEDKDIANFANLNQLRVFINKCFFELL